MSNLFSNPLGEWTMGHLPPVAKMRGSIQLNPVFEAGFNFIGKAGRVTLGKLLTKPVFGCGVPIWDCVLENGRHVQAHVGHILYYAPKSVFLGAVTFRGDSRRVVKREQLFVTRKKGVTESQPIINDGLTPNKTVRFVASYVRVGNKWTVSVSQEKPYSWFKDGLGYDVTAQVHAAVARLFAQLLKISVSPAVSEGCCQKCSAFRILQGPDTELGDSVSQFPSRSTGELAEGPFTVDKYVCAHTWETPTDLINAVNAANYTACRGYYTPPVQIQRAGEDCPRFIAKGTKPWDAAPATADEPVEVSDGLLVSAPSWDLYI